MAKARRKVKADPPPSSATSRHRLPATDHPLRYVFHQRPRCPDPDCRSGDLRIYRSKRHPDGAIERHVECRECGRRFILVVE